MKKLMAVFAALIFLVSSAAALEMPTFHAFGETWMKAWTLDKASAYVLDRDGQLFSWDYAGEPSLVCSGVPVAQDSMFGSGACNYLDLTADQQVRVNETVNLLAVAESMLYAINKYTGSIGTLDQDGVHWHAAVDEPCFLDGAGWERMITGKAVVSHQLYLLISYFDENPNADQWSRLLRIDLNTGATKLYDGMPAYRLCTYGDKLLMLCQEKDDYLVVFDPSTGETERLALTVPCEGALTYDHQADIIYLVTNEGVYFSQTGGEFALTANIPAEYAGGDAVITAAGQLAFTGGGVWAMNVPATGSQQRLTVCLHSADSKLKALFTQQYPGVLLDWRIRFDMTAADVANAIRTGDTTDVFSVQVDSSFGSLIRKGFAAPVTNSGIADSVARMYPSLSMPLIHQGSVVAYPWGVGVNTWMVNHTLWDKYFPDETLPATWTEFFNLMLTFEQADNPDGDLFLMYWDYGAMLEQVLTAYIQRQGLLGQPVDFTSSELTSALAALEAVHQSVAAYDEAEIFWDSETVGERSIFHYGAGGANHSAFLWNEAALSPFTFAAGDAPVYAGSMSVLIINPNAGNRELAEAFVAQLTRQEYSVMMDYCLHADKTEPYEQKPYTITSAMIEAWQSAVQNVHITTDNPLLSDAFLSQVRQLMNRCAVGQLPMEMMLVKLNETARLVEMEQ